MIHLFNDKYIYISLCHILIIMTLILFQNFTIFSRYISFSSSFIFFFRDKRVYDMVANKNFIEIKTINRERDKEKTFLRFDGILEKLTEYHNLRFLLNENKNIFT